MDGIQGVLMNHLRLGGTSQGLRRVVTVSIVMVNP